jgi:hypothetical protein
MPLNKLFSFLFLTIILMNGNAQESSVLKFENLFSLKLSMKYNFLSFSQPLDDYELKSNRPSDLGIGFGYKDFSFTFSINIPFLYDRDYLKSKSFDLNFTRFFGESIYFDGHIKYYDGFHYEEKNQINTGIDSKMFLTGISGEYIFNKNHSLRSVCNLDRKQLISNGSFLIGGEIFFSSISIKNELINYVDKQNVFYFGPNFGYSYTWIIKDKFFVNILMVLGINGTITDEIFNFNFQALPKLSFGYHGKTWSINLFHNYNVLIYHKNYTDKYNVHSGISSINFSKRLK